MWMIELAMKTMTAERRIGSQRDVRGTMLGMFTSTYSANPTLKSSPG
jgi:hypothetical protein